MLDILLHPFKQIKAFLPRTMFGRSLMILIMPLMLAQTISAYVFFDRHWDYITKVLAHDIAGEVTSITNLYNSSPEDAAFFLMLARTHLGFKVQHILKEELVQHVPEHWEESSLDRALRSQSNGRPYSFDIDDNYITIQTQVDNGVLKFQTTRKRLYSKTTPLFLMWAAGTTILFLFIATIFLRNQIKPLRRLSIAAEKLGKGRDAIIKPEGATEVRSLTQAFINMRRRLQRQISQRTDMLAGVSHDLRTPLTRMKLQLLMLEKTPEIEGLIEDVTEMETMVEGYLAFARGEGAEKPKRTEMKALIQKVCKNNNQQDRPVNYQSQGVVPSLMIRPNAITRALNNLIHNSQRYGENVWVTLLQENGYILIRVEDDGPSIPKNKIEEVFKPFFRVEESRNTTTGGVGLGLTIARDIVRNHGGDITLSQSPSHQGLLAQIRLPL